MGGAAAQTHAIGMCACHNQGWQSWREQLASALFQVTNYFLLNLAVGDFPDRHIQSRLNVVFQSVLQLGAR